MCSDIWFFTYIQYIDSKFQMAGVTSLLSKELALLKIQIAPETRPFAPQQNMSSSNKIVFEG